MEFKNNFDKYPENQINSSKNQSDTHSILFSEIKSKQNIKKNTCPLIRKNLLVITKEDIQDSKELIIKSYKEDLDSAKLKTNHSLNIINPDIYNDDNLEINNDEELDLEYTKNKYADKNCSSSNISD